MLNLREPVTRAEAIGWSLAGPLVLVLGGIAYFTYGNVAGIMSHYRPVESQLLPIARFFAWIGDVGVASVLLACAVLPVLALLTRQRPWLQACSPLIFGLLAFSFLHAMAAALASPSQALVQHYQQQSEQQPDIEGPPK